MSEKKPLSHTQRGLESYKSIEFDVRALIRSFSNSIISLYILQRTVTLITVFRFFVVVVHICVNSNSTDKMIVFVMWGTRNEVKWNEKNETNCSYTFYLHFSIKPLSIRFLSYFHIMNIALCFSLVNIIIISLIHVICFSWFARMIVVVNIGIIIKNSILYCFLPCEDNFMIIFIVIIFWMRWIGSHLSAIQIKLKNMSALLSHSLHPS